MISTFSFWKQGLGGTIIGGGTNGLWRSSDNGVTWTQVPGTSATTFLCIATDGKGNWLAGAYALSGASLVIWYSTNNGATFSSSPVLYGSSVFCTAFKAGKWLFSLDGLPSPYFSSTVSGPYTLASTTLPTPVTLFAGNSSIIIACVGSPVTAGAIWTSTDGNIWTKRSQTGDVCVDAVQTSDNTWYFTSDGGTQYGGTNAPVKYTTNLVDYTDMRFSSFGTPTAGGVLTSNATWNSVTYGRNGIFVAVASNYTIPCARSTDNGQTWVTTNVAMPFTTGTYTSVAFGNTRCVATTSAGGTVAVSSNMGVNWFSYNVGLSTNWIKVKFGNGIFMILSSSGQTATSTDGQTWTITGNTGATTCFDLAFGKGKWVVTSVNSVVCYSTNNGVTWTVNPTGMPFNTNYHSIAFGNGIFLAMGVANVSNQICAVSTTGTSFTLQSTPAVGTILPYATVYCAGAFVSTGYDTGQVMYTLNNGSTWTYLNMPSVSYWYGMAYGNSTVVFTGGFTNTTKSAYANIGIPTSGYIAASGNNYSIADGTANRGIFYPINSSSLQYTNINTGTFNDMAASGNNFVAASANKGLFYSSGGQSWSTSNVTSGTYYTVYTPPTGNVFVAGSSTSGYWYSTNNGSTWTQSVSNPTGNIVIID